MAKQIAIDDVIDGMEMQSNDVTAYLDRETGEIVAMNDEIVSL